jgi:hypothetical protein
MQEDTLDMREMDSDNWSRHDRLNSEDRFKSDRYGRSGRRSEHSEVTADFSSGYGTESNGSGGDRYYSVSTCANDSSSEIRPSVLWKLVIDLI